MRRSYEAEDFPAGLKRGVFLNGTRNRTSAVRRLAEQVRAAQRKLEKLAVHALSMDFNAHASHLGLLADRLRRISDELDRNADNTRSLRGKRSKKGE